VCEVLIDFQRVQICKRLTTLKREDLNLFEGIIIGLYGNWLISLIDKIDFEKITRLDIALQVANVGMLIVSFLFLILFFGYSIIKTRSVPIKSLLEALILHFLTWLTLLLFFPKGNRMELVFFGFLGFVLLSTLMICETVRRRSRT